MMRKLLSIITSVSLIASMASFGTYAAPSAVDSGDSAMFEVPIIDNIENNESGAEAELYVGGPSAVDSGDSAFETGTDFGKIEILEEAFFFADLLGEGTKESPYLISSKEDLILMANNVNSGINSSAYYKLTADIDLGGDEWTPIGHYNADDLYSVSFSGEFDGDGHTVSNFKITKYTTSFIGFFGYIYQGTVKNLNISDALIDVVTSKTSAVHAGVLASRIVTNQDGSEARIENCNISSSTVAVSGKGTIYAGGFAGSVVSVKDSEITLALSDAECDVTAVTTSATTDNVFAGGIAGTVYAQTGSTITVFNCGANGSILSDALDTIVASAMAGGAFGNLQTYENYKTGGSIHVSSCYSKGDATAKSYFKNCNAGGFAGQLFTTANGFITDCYSSANAAEQYGLKGNSENYDPCAGGFVGVITWPGFSSSDNKTITNCYASGNAVDLTYKTTDAKDTSFVGGFAGYSVGCEKDCYKLETQVLTGSDIFADTLTVLSAEQAKKDEFYRTFDFTYTWEIDENAEYPYPTLQEKTGYVTFYSEGSEYATEVFGTNGKVKKTSVNPQKTPTIDKAYTFIYWSLTENGSAFDFANTSLTENTSLYAVFSESPREYKINFMVDGTAFVPEQSIVYGQEFRAPLNTPEKADTEQYYYEFLHWSVIAGGEAYDFTSATVSGNMTFHAVFKEIDKSAWTGGIAENFASGFGTQELPYVISTSDEFALFAKVINEKQEGYTDAYYVLGNDINLGENYWTAIGSSKNTPFSANFDGKGYAVSNFNLAPSQFAGLFGYVLNGTIKNVNVANFTVNLSPVYDENKYDLEYNTTGSSLIRASFIGGLAAYVDSKKGTSDISGIRVSATKFNVDANFDGYIYAGNIAGYINSASQGKSIISDSFAISAITVKNLGGYAYAGGIAGQSVIKSGGLSQIVRCYNTGEISTSSRNSSYSGGLVGYLMSNGSGFVGGGAGEDDSATLSVDDLDIMIKDSFAVANIYANSSDYYSYPGRIAGSFNTHAGHEGAYYPRGSVVTITPIEKEVFGASVDLSSLQSREWLENDRGFDFENTWTFVSGSSYPVLKIMVSDKPVLKIATTSLSDGTLNAKIHVLSKEQNYTLVVGVYSARNQLIKLERFNLEKADSLNEIDVTYENMKSAKYISVSAVETASLKPLFSEVTKNI